jgi:CHAT domain-containing protein
MRARAIAVPAAVFSASLIFTAFTAVLSPELQTQSPASAAPASPALALPADAQAKLDKLHSDLIGARKKGDKKAAATALNALGDVYFGVSDYSKASDEYTQALEQARTAKDTQQEVAALNGMGNCDRQLSRYEKALQEYGQALVLAASVGDQGGQAAALSGMGCIAANTGQLQKSLELHTRAQSLAQGAKDRDLEANILSRIGDVNFYLGKNREALDYYNRALTIFRQVGDRDNQAGTLTSIGTVYDRLGEKRRALDLYGQALDIDREVGDRDGEATTRFYIGGVYDDLGEKQKALVDYSEALSVFRAVGDRDDEAATLDNIGLVYDALGKKQMALDYFEQALPIYHTTGQRDGEARTLISIGAAYKALGEKQKALDYFSQALPILRQVGDRAVEARTLNNIGTIYSNLGEKQKALDYFSQALPILRQVGDRAAEATTLSNIGGVYKALGEKQKALEYYGQALPIATEVSDPMLEALVYYYFMETVKSDRPALAVYFGKQAFNLAQQVRSNIQGLDKELQQSFLASISDGYREFAALLIEQGRLPEAQQVLDLLKQQEYTDYVRGDTAKTLSPLALTPEERQAEEDYAKSTGQIVALGEQWAVLKKITNRTPEQEQQYNQLSAQMEAASKGLNDYYARLYTLFGTSSSANRQVADVKGDVSLLKQALAKMPRTVALYTLVGGERYSVIVITGSTNVAREFAITEKDLNQKVAALQQALRNPRSDPRLPAADLYKILIGPVKADLDQAQAQTLVWSLDGALRYVPIAALYDGERYVVEQYNTVTITPVSIAHIGEKPDFSNLSAAAMGISRQYESGLSALPAVVGELDEVVNDAKAKGSQGVLPGTILLNGAFTEKAMENLLASPHAVVHIASHFVFQPGDDSQSYLLLAGKERDTSGYHMTVADFRDNQQLSFDDTDLLTLSACETGMSGTAGNGREVDGLGTTAQLKGAKAVISSLWEVNDTSTGALMADFYKRWAEGEGKISKVEALREAQLDLLQGRITPQSGASGRGFSTVENEPGTQVGSTGYAHPYYWAPFVLMGNWR